MTDPVHILIIDDSEDSRLLLQTLIEFNGHTAHLAADGLEARKILTEAYQPIALIVVDLQMPDEDGWCLLQQLRADPKTAKIPTIAITAYHSNIMPLHAEQAGFSGYMPKPIQAPAFLREISNLISIPIPATHNTNP